MVRKILFTFILLILFTGLNAQDSLQKKSLDNIPHESIWEKWMWTHRAVAFMITKERRPHHDTSYIRSYRKKLIVTVPVSTRILQFELVDWKQNERLQFSPNFRYDIGIGLSSRWATFIAHTGIFFSNKNNSDRGVTKFRDLQLNIYGNRFVSDLVFQTYRGFYISNSGAFAYKGEGPYMIREDIRADMFSVSSHYIFNNRKFSYRSSFAFTERQLKSAGSAIMGGYYTLFGVRADSSLVGSAFQAYFDNRSQIKEGSVQSFGINAGYIYTRTHKKVYSTISLVPGIGLSQTTYDREDGSNFRSHFNAAGKLNVRLGFGFDNGRFYTGMLGIYDYYVSPGKSNATFNHNSGKFMLFTGYRFNFEKVERKILKKLSLIEY